MELKMINIELLQKNPNNKRKELEDKVSDDNRLYQTIDGLAQNISEVGLINALTVEKAGDKYLIISGERRYLACKKLGWKEIKCEIITATEEEKLWINLSENLQRKDLSEVEKAEEFNQLRGDHADMSIRSIGKKLGVSEAYIRGLLKIHGYPDEIKEEIKQGNIGTDTIRSIAKLEEPQEQIKVVQHAIENDLNRKQVENIIDKIKNLPPDVKKKLVEETDYTVTEAIVEVYEPGEELPMEKSYNNFIVLGQQLCDVLTVDNIKSFNAMDKVFMKKRLSELKYRIDYMLNVIDSL